MDISEDQAIELLQQSGYGVEPPQQYRIDIEQEFVSLWQKVEPYTMTSLERGYALYKAIEYIVLRNIPGDFLECGVWRGGSCMLMALTLLHLKQKQKSSQASKDSAIPENICTDRKIHLFDTFNGMTEPGAEDKIAWNNRPVLDRWQKEKDGRQKDGLAEKSDPAKDDSSGLWSVQAGEVWNNLYSTGYPRELINLVPGDVAETLPQVFGEITGNEAALNQQDINIALLRLDTDWYKSTLLELEYLFPRLITGGVLIIDDYGHFTGARQAVDEYFAQNPLLFNRIDYTGRVGVKI